MFNTLYMFRVQCIKCAIGTLPDATGHKCLPCYNWPLDPELKLNQGTKCNCVHNAGLCLPDNLDIGDVYRETTSQYQIPYSQSTVDSYYFRNNLKAAAFMCAKYHNSTACNHLANMCVLTLHNR